MSERRRSRNGATGALAALLGFALWGVAGGALAQQLDICGCIGHPNSLGAFDSNDPNTWPPGSSQFSNILTIPLPAGGTLVFDSFLINLMAGNTAVNVILTPPPDGSPATILIAGDATIGVSDTLSVAGLAGVAGSNGGPGLGGLGGPGGFRGGDGAYELVNFAQSGGTGLGPGGGLGGDPAALTHGSPGTFVGLPSLLPLLGGAGGGGGASNSATLGCSGGGGGGGGGALLIAANGTLTIDGTISADGGSGAGNAPGGVPDTCSTNGGSGGGGAIRLIADTIKSNASNPTLTARSNGIANLATDGAIRLEAFFNTYPASRSFPVAFQAGAPGPITNPLEPTVAITDVGGVAISNPTGNTGGIDVIIPAPGLVTVDFETSGVPAGTNVDVSFKARVGDDLATQTVLLDPLSCTPQGICTGFTAVNMPSGGFTIEAQATFQ